MNSQYYPHNLEIFVDMDGVLVNFQQGCRDLMGPEFAYEHLPPAQFKVYREQLFNAIESTENFWLDLKPLPDFFQLYESLLQLGVKPTILTAVPRHLSPEEPKGQEVARQKQAWIHKHLGNEASSRFIATQGHLKQEHMAQGKLNVLIDDLRNNIQRWQSKGGIGILHRNAEDTLQRLHWRLRP